MTLVLEAFGHSNNEAVEKLASKYNLVIPDDYKAFLLEQNGGINPAYQFKNVFRIDSINEEINIEIMYGIDTGVKNADIEQWTDEYHDDIFEQSLIIGDSMQHGFLLLWLSGDENQGVYYYDDTYEIEASSDENNAYFLTKTFSEFVELVQN